LGVEDGYVMMFGEAGDEVPSFGAFGALGGGEFVGTD